MRTCILSLLFLSISFESAAQASDFIVLRKKNNRTLKTYGPGSFISARTYSDFQINGFIKDIRNDSIIIQQQETKLMSTEFGQKVDTLRYTYAIDYRQIKSFYFSKQYDGIMRRRGFTQVALPPILMIGGTGFILLEVVNSIYRKESLSDRKKLLSMGIAAGVAGTGILLQTLQSRKDKVGVRYKVFYVKNAATK
jgi:hypothetical protein